MGKSAHKDVLQKQGETKYFNSIQGWRIEARLESMEISGKIKWIDE